MKLMYCTHAASVGKVLRNEHHRLNTSVRENKSTFLCVSHVDTETFQAYLASVHADGIPLITLPRNERDSLISDSQTGAKCSSCVDLPIIYHDSFVNAPFHITMPVETSFIIPKVVSGSLQFHDGGGLWKP